jgi:hypothetical protein
VPVLARTFEKAGMATIMVTNMPFWAEKVGAPRTLAVEFPFGHILGQLHNPAMQRKVILEALDVLEKATIPGTIVCSEVKWPEPFENALRVSHPPVTPPIAAEMARYIGKFLMGMRRGAG